MLLSVAIHAAPSVAMALWWTDTKTPSPPPSKNLRGVALVYLDAPNSEWELVEHGDGNRTAQESKPVAMEPPQQESQRQHQQRKKKPIDNVVVEVVEPAALMEVWDVERPRVLVAATDHFTRHTQGIPVPGESSPQPDTSEDEGERPSVVVSHAPVEARREAVDEEDQQVEIEQIAVWQPWVAGSSANEGVRAAQDRQRLIDSILARVAAVMPLVYWKLNRSDAIYGTAFVRFVMSRDGYVDGFEVIESQGDRDIELAAYHALVLASPYVYSPGWIELTLVFQR